MRDRGEEGSCQPDGHDHDSVEGGVDLARDGIVGEVQGVCQESRREGGRGGVGYLRIQQAACSRCGLALNGEKKMHCDGR
jgi:hypothetical protein